MNNEQLNDIEFEKIDVLELLPQKPQFVMVDKLVHFDKIFTVTYLKVKADSIFVENNVLTESGVIENIAQTCAVRMGYINKHICSGDVKIGFIGSIKDLIFNELPKVGDLLKTTIEVESEIFSITLVKAKVEVEEKLVVSCEMKISITDINKV